MDTLLTIESEEAVRLATRLADLTGETIEETLVVALRARLAAEELRRREDRLDQRRETWMTEATRLACEARDEFARGNAGPLTSNHDFLYDDDGLPF